MKRKILIVSAIIIASLKTVSGMAQTDVTSSISNPEFSSSVSPWTVTGVTTSTNKISTSAKGDGSVIVAGQGHWQLFCTGTGKAYQIITGLPNGLYTLQAGVYTKFTGTLNLYANTSKTPINSDVSSYYQVVNTLVTNGTLEIGLDIAFTGAASSNDIEFDHVSLAYNGPDLVASVAYLKERINIANGYVNNSMNNNVLSELQAAISDANTTANATTPDETMLTTSTTRLENAIKSAEGSITAYASLATAITNANTNKVSYTTFPGYSNFESSINAAQAAYNAKDLDNAGITTAITTLTNAELTCRLTQPAPFDATFAILNSSFEGNTFKNASNLTVPVSWTLDATLTSSDVKLSTSTPGDGTYKYSLWASSITSLDLYQDLVLPSGNYQLSALLHTTSSTEVTDQHLYVIVGENTLTSSVLTYDAANYWIPMTTNFTVPTGGATVRIGAKSSGAVTATSAGNFSIDKVGLSALVNISTGIEATSNEIRIWGRKGGISIQSSKEIVVCVHDILGRKVKTQTVNGNVFVSLAPGIYIVNGQKVIVKA